MDYLNPKNGENLANIAKEYRITSFLKTQKAKKETEALAERIDDYRRLSYDDIVAKIKKEAKEQFYDIEDKVALRRALFEAVEKSYEDNYDFSRLSRSKQINKINANIREIVNRSTPKDLETIVKNYRRNGYEKYIEEEGKKAQAYQNMYQSMSDEELKDYISLHYDFRLSKNLLDAREEAISNVADKEGAELPLCMVDEAAEKAINRAVRYVVKQRLQSDPDKSLKERVRIRAKNAMETLNENANAAAMISTLGIVLGGSAFCGVINSGYPEFAIAAWAFTTPVIIAALSASYTRIVSKDDKESLEEADTLGLLKRRISAEKSRKQFYTYHNEMKKQYSGFQIEGGKNGLHQ